jgi:protein-tyrosine phosphatase
MDKENYDDVNAMDLAGRYKDKVSMMTDYAKNNNADSVPDPYYGGPDGFELVLDLLEDSCEGLLEHIKNRNGL